MVNWIGPPEMAKDAAQMFDEMAEIMRNHHPFVQGAVLADLLALWIAGHFTENEQQTIRIRDKILDEHIKAVRKLIPINEKIIVEQIHKTMPKH